MARSRRRTRAPSPPWIIHDLTRAELIGVQRAVAHLAGRGMAPTVAEFWRGAALPRAQRLVDSARAVIDAGTELPWSGPGTLPAPVIDDLGRWWLRRLRRAAILHALPDLGACPPGELARRLAHHEMRLLSQPPWLHGDLLLSAFELAHREIARHHGHQLMASRALPGGAPLAPAPWAQAMASPEAASSIPGY